MSDVPKHLYKYRAFGVNTLSVLVSGEVYYPAPADFNDPLDCQPAIRMDLDRERAERLFHVLCAEVGVVTSPDDMAKLYNAPRSLIETFSGQDAEYLYLQRLATKILKLAVARNETRGVFALAERYDCPLMWSHYGDNHKGICLEYDTSQHGLIDLKQVDYALTRVIDASTLYEWKVQGLRSAGKLVDRHFFAAKAPDWDYEREWRVVHPLIGAGVAPFALSGIYFGLRCPDPVKTTITKVFAGRPDIRFSSLFTTDSGFGLYPMIWSNEVREPREAFGVTTWFLQPGAQSSVFMDDE
ncbi:Protein of unknown function (DUF2971) [Luteibacter sp. OK325]|uniref:DUF2971 domain-containing protein n=1 Tax=Luteibacter sp. OK325 TaxID=2135670 RepID=UPI000D33E71C|nr:DUF2971 domain-containing protein [Luteibacter sp. OK325]PTR33023.1 Protein of unknown function (DUF2971) [Luteibacter sp. OK325]